jgi:hypothetical protein
MSADWVRAYLGAANPEAALWGSLDAGLVGVVERCGTQPVALYSRKLCIETLVAQWYRDHPFHPRMKLDVPELAYTQASEYFDFNVGGAYIGEHTPFIATFPEDES